MGRYLMTHSLLSSWLYTMKGNPYEDMTTERDPMAEFMLTLRREPTPTTEAMQNGIDFEDLVTSIINGRGDPNNQWYAAAEKVARRCAGGILQYSWCDMFVDWCYITTFGLGVAMKMTNQPMGGYGAGCTQSAGYYRAVGRFHKSNPQPGDQIFFTKDGGKSMYHTGLVEKVSGGRVYTIEGNTSSAPGVVPNGGMVRNKSYSINYAQIGGYGTPDWSLVKEEEEMAEITQDKFNEMFKVAMNAYRAELQDNDCGNFSADGRKFVEETGLLVGGSKLPNGEANFMWQDFLTREQFATVLYRFAQKFGLS